MFSTARLRGVAAYYGNRAAAWLMVGAHKESAADCRRAIALDPAYHKGHLRLAKALCEMSEVGLSYLSPAWVVTL